VLALPVPATFGS